MPRVIAISSQKGGVGKTTTAKELAAAWGESGRGVLVIDADPSFAVTRALGLTSRPDATVYDVMKGDCDLSAATSPASAPGVDPRGSTCVFERSSRHGPIHHGGSTGNSLSRPTTAARRH